MLAALLLALAGMAGFAYALVRAKQQIASLRLRLRLLDPLHSNWILVDK